MRKLGSIVIIDDDTEDLEILSKALDSLKVVNKVLLFDCGSDFIKHVQANNDDFFFILCDINMPTMNGFELLGHIKADPVLAANCFPFILFSTSWNIEDVKKAYSLPIQGYLKKPSSFKQIVKTLENVIAYWDSCFNTVSLDYGVSHSL